MKNEHIFQILDEKPFEELNASEFAKIERHAAACADCRRAFNAAKISSDLLKSHAAQQFKSSPFFQTRILAALREQKSKSIAAFRLWWQAASALVMTMLLIVSVLGVFVILESNNEQTASGEDTGESVIFTQNDSQAKLTNNQALQMIYEQHGDLNKR
jgi:anti-sigma factor RsiW